MTSHYAPKLDTSALLHPPRPPFLAVIKDRLRGDATLAIPGSMLLLKWGEGEMDMWAGVLSKLSRREMTLRCPCGQPGCTQEIVLTLAWRGKHPTQKKKEG